MTNDTPKERRDGFAEKVTIEQVQGIHAHRIAGCHRHYWHTRGDSIACAFPSPRIRAPGLVPESNLEDDEGLWHRRYDRGLVAVNPHQDMTRRAWLALPEAVEEPVDLYTGQLLKSENRRTYVSTPPQFGRVVVARSDAIRNFLAECAAFLNDIAREMDLISDAELKQLELREDVDGAKAARLAQDFGRLRQDHEVLGKETAALLAELVAWLD